MLRPQAVRRHGGGRDGDGQNAHHQQRAWPKSAAKVDQQPAHSVGDQNISAPQKVSMRQAKQNQPAHAPVVQSCRGLACGLDAAGHEQNSGSEQHGENRHELLVCEDMAQQPDPEICSAQIAIRSGIPVGGADHREILNVHGENAQQRETAQHVDADDALFFGNRLWAFSDAFSAKPLASNPST